MAYVIVASKRSDAFDIESVQLRRQQLRDVGKGFRDRDLKVRVWSKLGAAPDDNSELLKFAAANSIPYKPSDFGLMF